MDKMAPDFPSGMQDAMKRPEGTLQFGYTSAEVFGTNDSSGIVFQVVAGAHLFRLERSSDRVLHFFHSSPGTGTRVASISLGNTPAFERALLFLTWSPTEMRLACGPLVDGGRLLMAAGVPSERRFRVGEDGTVLALGDRGVQVMEVRIFRDGEALLQPTALEVWGSTVKSIEVLWTGSSPEGYLFETVLASLTLTILVTGLEAFASSRLQELESEGIRPDVPALFDEFASRAEREAGGLDELMNDAQASGVAPLRKIMLRGSINFQNYNHIRRAFNRAYGVKLGEIGVPSPALERLQRLVKYRHRVVHVSPMLGTLNGPEAPPEEPEFANRAFADGAVRCFDQVVRGLHAATLVLRPA